MTCDCQRKWPLDNLQGVKVIVVSSSSAYSIVSGKSLTRHPTESVRTSCVLIVARWCAVLSWTCIPDGCGTGTTAHQEQHLKTMESRRAVVSVHRYDLETKAEPILRSTLRAYWLCVPSSVLGLYRAQAINRTVRLTRDARKNRTTLLSTAGQHFEKVHPADYSSFWGRRGCREGTTNAWPIVFLHGSSR